MHQAIVERYPTSHELEDGAKVTCSLMSRDDREALARLLSRLTRSDLAYLQSDITSPEVQERWMDSIEEGKSICICAYDPRGLVGYASVQISEEDGRSVGEIRVNIVQGYRSRGLGRILIAEIFQVARLVKLNLVTARMLSDQYGARSAFKRLGFIEDRVLENEVKDASGSMKDLLVMSSPI